MRSIILWISFLVVCSCSQKNQMKNNFLVIPGTAFLKQNEKVAFNFTFPGPKLVDNEGTGKILSDSEFQAPNLIEKTQEVKLTFKFEKRKTQIPVYLLDERVEVFNYQNDWISLPLPDKVVESNVWGLSQSGQEIKKLALTQFQIEADQYIAWEWAATNQLAHTILAYPEIVFGWKPWRDASTTSALPRVLDQIQAIPVSYEFAGSAKGAYNLAFDCWINQSMDISKENILTEIMIWESWANLNPIGQLKEKVESPYGIYEFWQGSTADGWDCLTFRKVPSGFNQSFDLYWFLNYLIEKELIQPDQILASVEFGNEIGKGSGTTILKNYQINVE